MFDWLSELLEHAWSFFILIIIVISLTALPLTVSAGKTNLEKFNSIDIDLTKTGFNKEALQVQFKKDPRASKNQVEKHKRTRFMLVTKDHENAITEQFVEQMKSLDILWNNAAAETRCNKILKRLAAVMPKDFTPPEKIYILDTPEINACCLPNGTIVVFRGLLVKHNDDELAWILAHELGHGVAHHSAEMLSKTIIQELAIDSFIDENSGLLKIAGTHIAAFVTNLKYSRTQENEADRLALFYVNKAGYDMNGAVTTLNKFETAAGKDSKWKEWLSTHPHPTKRLKNVKKAIAQLKKNPDHTWGGLKEELLEKAKDLAIEHYLNKQK